MSTRRRERLRIVAAGAVVVTLTFVGLAGYSVYRNYSIHRGFAQIRMGDAQSKVTTLMGKPNKVVLPGDSKFWASRVKGCVKEYQYEASILPEIWVIGFDSKDTVVYRNHNIM